MARGVNKVILIGNLGADPEVNFSNGGNVAGNFRMATEETWKDKDGNPHSRTEWHRIVVYGKLAEIVNNLCQKGTQVYVEGSIVTRKWQDQSGEDRYTTEIKANSVEVLNNGRQNGGNAPAAQPQGNQNQQQNSAPQNQGGQQAPAPQQQGNQNQQSMISNAGQGGGNAPAPQDDFDDDIPF